MSNEKFDNGKIPAFPIQGAGGWDGLTKREYFAAMAMQGMLSRDAFEPQEMADNAVSYSDALLAELEKNPHA